MKPILLLSLLVSTLTSAAMKPVSLPSGTVERLDLGIEPLRVAPVSDPVTATGQIILDPLATAVVASPVSGRIETDTLRRGARVKAGQALLTLRSSERAAAITTYLTAEERLRFARAAYTREQQLEEKKLTTTEALREREMELARARTAHLSAIQKIHLLGLSEQKLHDMIDEQPVRTDLSEQVVKSPIDGVIIEKQTTPGAPVERNAQLLTIASLNHLLIQFRVPLRGVDRVKEGKELRFRAIVGGAGEGTATIIGLLPSADSDTLAVLAGAKLENPNGNWIAGTPVEVILDDAEAPQLPAVPVGSVVHIDGTPCVFVAESKEVFRPQPVEIVAESGESLGLKGIDPDGVRVVTRGAALLLAAWEEAHASN